MVAATTSGKKFGQPRKKIYLSRFSRLSGLYSEKCGLCVYVLFLKLIKYKNYLLKITIKLYGIELQNENTWSGQTTTSATMRSRSTMMWFGFKWQWHRRSSLSLVSLRSDIWYLTTLLRASGGCESAMQLEWRGKP